MTNDLPAQLRALAASGLTHELLYDAADRIEADAARYDDLLDEYSQLCEAVVACSVDINDEGVTRREAITKLRSTLEATNGD